MPLTIRPTGLGSGIDKDRPDYTVYSGGWAVGRIYETRGGPITAVVLGVHRHRPMTRSDRVSTLEEAKAQFETAWRQWLAWTKLQGMP